MSSGAPALTRALPSLTRPRQAVILAGGRGERLGALTDDLPKPMLEFHGRPFLEYLVELLAGQGFDRVLLLLGYRPEPIRAHFAGGDVSGVCVECRSTPPEALTLARLRDAHPHLDRRFLLMYCDNYWPMCFADMWREFEDARPGVQLTAYANRDRRSAGNLRLDEHGYVTRYDPTRKAPGLQAVDIGFAIVERAVLDAPPAADASFEDAVYPRLVRERRLRAFLTDHPYYSVGSPDRLARTERFLARTPTVILDRDGVLNRRPPRGRYVEIGRAHV